MPHQTFKFNSVFAAAHIQRAEIWRPVCVCMQITESVKLLVEWTRGNFVALLSTGKKKPKRGSKCSPNGMVTLCYRKMYSEPPFRQDNKTILYCAIKDLPPWKDAHLCRLKGFHSYLPKTGSKFHRQLCLILKPSVVSYWGSSFDVNDVAFRPPYGTACSISTRNNLAVLFRTLYSSIS